MSSEARTARHAVIVSWSGGKDSTLMLHELLRGDAYEVVALLTTVTAGYERISIHGVRRALLERQAASLGIPLSTAELAPNSGNEQYERALGEPLLRHRERGHQTVAFGDLFLADVRAYREAQIEALGMRAVFPVWHRDTDAFARRFLKLGYRAVVTCVDGDALDGAFAGREYDENFLADLPDGIDPCGENGEFHTFVYDGPVFREPIRFERGERVLRDGRFHYFDLLETPDG